MSSWRCWTPTTRPTKRCARPPNGSGNAMPDWRIERLTAAHERGSFSCGKASLDEFLRQLATQYERRNRGRTFVAVRPDDPTVHGYYTLASGSVAFANLPDDVSRKLPRHPI